MTKAQKIKAVNDLVERSGGKLMKSAYHTFLYTNPKNDFERSHNDFIKDCYLHFKQEQATTENSTSNWLDYVMSGQYDIDFGITHEEDYFNDSEATEVNSVENLIT